jgi:hypothetical protein
VPNDITFGFIVNTATAQEMDECINLDRDPVQSPEDGSCAPRDKWWHWIYLEINVEEGLGGVPLVNYADSQSKMEQWGKAAEKAFAKAVA